MNEPTRNRFTFTTSSFAPGELEVASIVGSEAISTPFSFDIDAIVNVDRGSIEDLLGARARLAFHGTIGRQIDGIVTRVEAHPMADDLPVYRFHLAPTLSLLGFRKTSRIFQEMTAPEIVQRVLADSHIEQAWGLERTYPKREYCVQYRETDLAFVTRLLAEEGILYFFADPPADNGDAQETVVFADSAAEYTAIAGDPRIRFRNTGGLERDEHVLSFSFGKQVGSGSTLHRSYDFKRPLFDLQGEARVGGRHSHIDPAELSVYEHDNDPEERQIHGSAAQIALAQLKSRTATGAGYSTCQRLVPGKVFELWDHPHGNLCRKYALVRVDHEVHQVAGRRLHGTQADTYKNCFYCVPDKVAYRPERRHRELQQVTETATVVGPAGEEIHVDEYGRIKVQFHWDRYGRNDEHSSCWLRTMQQWAGAGWGTQFIPRIGMEVVVTFVQGDVDRPLVLGTVYNAVAPSPFALPASATQSGWRTRSSPGGNGSNEFRFEDAAGNEKVFLHAQRDHEEVVGHDHYSDVAHHQTVHVGGDRYLATSGNAIETVQKSQAVTIQEDMILHIVGRQFIQIDGLTTGGGQDDSNEAESQAPESPIGGKQSPGSQATTTSDKGCGPTEVSRALLLWAAEHVPEDQYASARLQVRSVDAFAQELSLHCMKALEGLSGADAAGREAAGDGLRAFGNRVGAATLDVMSKRAASHPEVCDAAIKALQSLHADSVRARAALASGPDGADELSGVIRGGGGGGSGNCPEIPTPRKPKAKDTGTVKVKGAYTMDSPDGLTLKGQGANLTLKGDKLDGNGRQIVLEAGDRLRLVVGASVIEMLPGAINISTSGVIKLWGGMILLNS